MTRGPDPYVQRCDYREAGSQFGEPFESTDPSGQSGSHNDSYLNQYRPKRNEMR